jgi:hypothetical protein
VKRLSNTFKRKVHIRSPFLLCLLSLIYHLLSTCIKMSDLSSFRVLNFSGRKGEWPTWSETFLAKATHSGIKDVLLGKLQSPRTSEEFEEKSEEGRRMMKNADLNNLEVSNRSGRIAFGIFKVARQRIMKMGIQPKPGRSLRRRLTQYPPLH